MSRNEQPQNHHFNNVTKLSNYENYLDLSFLLLSLIQILYKPFNERIFVLISSIFLITSFLFSYLLKHEFSEGSSIRYKGFLDNSFGEKRLHNGNLSDYYDNEDIDKGLVKVLANVHTNSLFTSRIADKNKNIYLIIGSFVIISFTTIVLYSGVNSVTELFLSFIIGSSIIRKGISYRDLSKEAKRIFDQSNLICSDLNYEGAQIKAKTSRILDVLVSYESILAKTSVPLSARIFNKLNPELTKEWRKVKSCYKIYNKAN